MAEFDCLVEHPPAEQCPAERLDLQPDLADVAGLDEEIDELGTRLEIGGFQLHQLPVGPDAVLGAA